jgi:hypothetical protein
MVCPSIGGTIILGERACVAVHFPHDPIEITYREDVYVHANECYVFLCS